MTRLSDLSALTTPAAGDLIPITDSSDTSGSPDGTTKYITYEDLFAAYQARATWPVELTYAISDEGTALTVGTAKLTVRAPYAFTLTAVRASLNVASSSGIPTFDINEAGATVLSTKLTVDVGETTSVSATTPAAISDATIADDAEISFDIDVAGTGAKGAKITLYGTRAL